MEPLALILPNNLKVSNFITMETDDSLFELVYINAVIKKTLMNHWLDVSHANI